MAQNDISDCSGELLYASLYNTQIDKDSMSFLDNINIDESDNIIDIELKAKEITYNDFRLILYPTTTGHLHMNKSNKTYLRFDQWEIETDDGTHPFIFHDYIMSALQQQMGVNKHSLNPALRILLDKKLVQYVNFTDFIKNGSLFALTWHEITLLLEQIGTLYNTDENEHNDPICLTMILNFKPPFKNDLFIRIHCPFIVTGIYKGWSPISV